MYKLFALLAATGLCQVSFADNRLLCSNIETGYQILTDTGWFNAQVMRNVVPTASLSCLRLQDVSNNMVVTCQQNNSGNPGYSVLIVAQLSEGRPTTEVVANLTVNGYHGIDSVQLIPMQCKEV